MTDASSQQGLDIAKAELWQSDQDIACLLGPHKAIAFVGSTHASPMLRQQFSRYGDTRLFIVNPKGGDAGSIPVLPSVLDLPEEVDLVIVKVGPRAIPSIIADCGVRGIKHALLFTDGYSETGLNGATAERELVSIARRNNVRILGPNTNDNVLEIYPQSTTRPSGQIALITQSGANGRSVVEGVEIGANLYRWVTTGNEADLEVADFIHHFAGVDDVAVIALYVEGFKNSDKLKIALDRSIRAGKPVIAIKIGMTASGTRAALSHTGHLVGTDSVINGLFRQFGVTRVQDVDELLETANLFSKLPLDVGSGCAMYTVSGGTAALMAEHAETNELQLPRNPPDLCERLHQLLPHNLSVTNPIDNGGAFLMKSGQGDRLAVFDLIASNPNVDLIVIGMNSARSTLTELMTADILRWEPTEAKPLVVVWPSPVIDTSGYRNLVRSGVPIFSSFAKCMQALGARQRYLQRRINYSRPVATSVHIDTLLCNALDRGDTLTARETSSLLRSVGVQLPKEMLISSISEVPDATRQIGFPLVLKLIASGVPHKTDRGFVCLNITSIDQAEAAAAELFRRAEQSPEQIDIEGILVQEQILGGIEMIVGLTQDPQFRTCLTIGAGGIYTEVLKDVVTTPLPVTACDIGEMIDSLRIAPLLHGVRGAPPVGKDMLIRLSMSVAALGETAGPRISEMDLNPVILVRDRAVAIDALVVGRAPRQAC